MCQKDTIQPIHFVTLRGVSIALVITLLGFSVITSEFAPSTFTTGQYIGILGDFSHYWIANAMNMQIQRLNELYAETNQVGFIGRLETERAGARGGVCPAEAGLRKWRGGVARRKWLLHALIKECAWRKPWPNAATPCILCRLLLTTGYSARPMPMGIDFCDRVTDGAKAIMQR